MSKLTWLHLSDWHQHGAQDNMRDFNRRVVRDALMRDISQRTSISPDLAELDFIIFSGDVAFSGKEEEYQLAITEFFEPVLEASGLTSQQLFIVPGNHDVDRSRFYLLPPGISIPFTEEQQVVEWFMTESERSELLKPFRGYTRFASKYTPHFAEAYMNFQRLSIRGLEVGLVGLNSALLSARYKDTQTKEVDDRGHLVVGEPQVYDALNHLGGLDVRIAIIHHPLDWLIEFDRNRVEQRLRSNFHFILHGHLHSPDVQVARQAAGTSVVIPGGASYARRTPGNQRYANSYNYMYVDFQKGEGVAHIREWNDVHNRWVRNTTVYENGKLEFELVEELKDLGQHVPMSVVSAEQIGVMVVAEASRGALREARELSEETFTINAMLYFSDPKMLWYVMFDSSSTVQTLLDHIHYQLNDRHKGSKAGPFGTTWILQNRTTGTTYTEMGRDWVALFGVREDNRSLADVGILPGTLLEVIPIKEQITYLVGEYLTAWTEERRVLMQVILVSNDIVTNLYKSLEMDVDFGFFSVRVDNLLENRQNLDRYPDIQQSIFNFTEFVYNILSSPSSEDRVTEFQLLELAHYELKDAIYNLPQFGQVKER